MTRPLMLFWPPERDAPQDALHMLENATQQSALISTTFEQCLHTDPDTKAEQVLAQQIHDDEKIFSIL